jgi:hypothetical protein
VISLTDELELHENGWRQAKFRLAGFGGAQARRSSGLAGFPPLDEDFHEGGSRRAQCGLERGPNFVRFGTAKAHSAACWRKGDKVNRGQVASISRVAQLLPPSFTGSLCAMAVASSALSMAPPVSENGDALSAWICNLGCDAIG